MFDHFGPPGPLHHPRTRKSYSGMNRTISRSVSLTSSLALAWGVAIAHPLDARGQELPWIPAGMVRVDFAPTFWTWDSRYGLGSDGDDVVELLGLDLTGNPLGSDLLPDLMDLEADLAIALDDPSYRVKLGTSQAFIDQSRLVFPFRAEIGVTDWLTVGGMVPLVRPRTELTFVLDADETSATDGISPWITDRNQVMGFLDTFRSALTSAEATHGSEQAFQDALTYLNALNRAYSHDTFFPVEGSDPAVQLQQRFDDLKSALEVLGVNGLPTTVPVAGGYLNEDAFADFLADPKMRAFPLEDYTTPWALGDVEITASVRLLRGGFEPDSLGVLPSLRYQVGGGVLVRLGTGGQEDPARFFDQDVGDGQMDLEGNAFGLVEYGSRFGAWAQVRYGIQQEGEIFRRITRASQPLPGYDRTAPVKWTPGNYFELDLNPRYFLTPAMSFGLRYHLWSKGADSYSLGDVEALGLDPAALPPAELLDLETEQRLQEMGFTASFSTVDAYHRGDASLPVHVRFTYLTPIGGNGGQTPKGGRLQAGLTIFKTFWGGRDDPEPEGDPVGR
jgi:hypothetical protein